MTIFSPARLSSAYTAPMRSGCKKRTLASSNIIGSIRVLKDEPLTRESALSMALDSRELRFYSSSSTQISRAASTTDNNGRRTTSESVSTTVKSIDGSMSFTATYASKTASIRSNGNNNGVLAPPISMYSAGLVNLLNTFDAEFKRAFSQRNNAAYQQHHRARYSTSSTLLSSLEDVPRAPNSRWKQQKQQQRPSHIEIDLTKEEQELFSLLRQVTNECGMKSTLRVAGGWVRDKILASKEFSYARSKIDLIDDNAIPAGLNVEMDECGDEVGEMKRITSKFKGEKGEGFCDVFFITVDSSTKTQLCKPLFQLKPHPPKDSQ